MHKSYKRKNSRNKTRKKYYKVGGGDDDPIIEPITTSEISEPITASQITEINIKITSLYDSINSIIDEIPVCIGYKFIPIYRDPGRGGPYSIKYPLCVKRNIDSETFLEIIGNTGTYNLNVSHYRWRETITNNLIDLKAVYSLPNVRGLPLDQCSKNMTFEDQEDRELFEVLWLGKNLNKINVQKLQVKYQNLFASPDPKKKNDNQMLDY
jgi:hypothetical protein